MSEDSNLFECLSDVNEKFKTLLTRWHHLNVRMFRHHCKMCLYWLLYTAAMYGFMFLNMYNDLAIGWVVFQWFFTSFGVAKLVINLVAAYHLHGMVRAYQTHHGGAVEA